MITIDLDSLDSAKTKIDTLAEDFVAHVSSKDPMDVLSILRLWGDGSILHESGAWRSHSHLMRSALNRRVARFWRKIARNVHAH